MQKLIPRVSRIEGTYLCNATSKKISEIGMNHMIHCEDKAKVERAYEIKRVLGNERQIGKSTEGDDAGRMICLVGKPERTPVSQDGRC